ncbi:MAG: DUF3179 domain-containing protein [Nitrososphaerota archaeon]
MNYRYIAAIVGGISLVGLVLGFYAYQQPDSISNSIADTKLTTIPDQAQITNGVKHLIPLDEIKSGGPPKDGIPSIDNPKFVKDAEFVSDDDLVIGLRLNGETRAYPLFILVWHEIVNDKIGNTPVAVTYCPLCFTTQVFDRTINGKETEFGTSGKLYNSNLVMYDRNTDSMWSQALGKAVVGELTGYGLKRIPFDLAKWSDWKKLYPDTVILSTDTGHSRPYGSDPYGDYYTDSRVIFPVKNSDDRMHPKEIILGFDHNESYKAYKLSDIESQKIINEKNLILVSVSPSLVRAFDSTVDSQALEFTLNENTMVDKQTGSKWSLDGLAISGPLQGKQLERIPFNPGFWFEWVAFHPTTEVYQIT